MKGGTPEPLSADVLLINPPSGLFYGLGPNFAPMGLFHLAACLRAHGFSAAVLNANFFPNYQTSAEPWSGAGRRRPESYYYADDLDNLVWAQVLRFVERVGPGLAGFSCPDLAVGGVKHLARLLKQKNPELIIAVGGPTPSGAADIFDDCPELDYLLAGEGERTLLELAEILRAGQWRKPEAERLKHLAGLYHRLEGEGRFIFNGRREPMADLDAWPRPERNYYWLDYARERVVKDVQLNGLATSRGCLKACRFCGARSIWPGPVRYRSIARVIEEITELRRKYGYDFQHFSIFDDDFLARPERVFEFCRRLGQLPDEYIFRCYGRVSNLQSEEMVETLLRTGCQEIWVGVESGSPKVLKALGKGITVEQIQRVDRLFRNYDFPWLAFIILGTPPEAEEDIEATLKMLRAGAFPSIQPFTFQPYTGTELFRRMFEAGLISYEEVIRGHQNLPQCFSQLVDRERFFELLAELNQLADERRRAWVRDFALTAPQSAEAAAGEDRLAAWLSRRPGRRIVALGPERQLRWLAALNHYRALKADLLLVDIEAREPNETVFGRLLPPAALQAAEGDEVLLVTPPAREAEWRARAAGYFPKRPPGVETNAHWRQVSDICRRPGGR